MKQTMEKKTHLFTNKELILLLLPLIVEQLLTSLMGTVDTVMVSNVGSEAISAVSLVDSINILVIQAFNALAAGGTILCSQYLGAQRRREAEAAAAQVVLTTAVLSVAVSAVCIALRSPLLTMVFGKVEQEVMRDSRTYFFYTALSFPFIAVYGAGAAVYRAQNNTGTPMAISVTSNFLNIGGNAFLIWVMHMGVAGAAIATLASRVFCAVVVMWLLRKPRPVRRRPDLRRSGRTERAGVQTAKSREADIGLETNARKTAAEQRMTAGKTVMLKQQANAKKTVVPKQQADAKKTVVSKQQVNAKKTVEPEYSIAVRDYRNMRPDWDCIKRIMAIGIPSGVENAMFQFGKLAIQSTVSTLGTATIAAHAMASMLENMNGIAGIGIGIGLMTVVGQCIGAGRDDEAVYYIKKLSLWGEAAIVLSCLAVFAAAKPVTILGGMEPESARLCMQMMTAITLAKPIAWICSYVPAYGMRAAGDVRYSMLVTCLSMWLFRVTMAMLLCRYTNAGPMSAWLAMFTDWSVRAVIFVHRFHSRKWLRHRVIA